MLVHNFLFFLTTSLVTSSFNKNNIFTAKHIVTTTTTTTERTILEQDSNVVNINQRYANVFKLFIDKKSLDLYKLTNKFVRFDLINETYNVKLRSEIKVSYNNYTEMVKTISDKLSRVLFQKTQVVMNLSEVVENAYVDYRFNLDKVNQSTTHVYYDSKSPKTFCDNSEPLEDLVQMNDFNSMISSYYNNQSSILNTTIKSKKSHNNDLKQLFWDVQCLNRSLTSHFNKVKKVNLLKSTVHVPTNIFKQNLAINMTAFWTESLNKNFRINNELNSGLDWQYFCSSLGLYRQYPGAYWSVPPKEDFYDCRLQSWYMSAATSAKDVLILLDTSGSMTGMRLEIGKKLIEFLFDTFTDNDFFNIITYSNEATYLIPRYSDMFVQAGKSNKETFKEALFAFKNTSHQGKLKETLIKAFQLFNSPHITRSGCNKVIMIITDGQPDEVTQVFQEYNEDKQTRIFSFKIGRDTKDLNEIKQLACDNNGEFFHVTLTDINEHVSKYISVLSRPMALLGIHETHWSNVFIGYLDKQLKIAAARPAFIRQEMLLADISKLDKETIDYTSEVQALINQNQQLKSASDLLTNQKVLLGVVGVDVPVLKLISQVSPKYMMGVGLYLIMLDNNGYVVYHPSIRQILDNDETHSQKRASHSIDLDTFEIPISSQEVFDLMIHEIIDGKSNKMTLLNWKRDGSRLLRRVTEYVYAPIFNTPFSIILASPNSFGHFYIKAIDQPEFYDQRVKGLFYSDVKTFIQLLNCTYTFYDFVKKTTIKLDRSDSCISEILASADHLLSVKLDLVLNEHIFESTEDTVFIQYPQAVRSLFYGSYSGVTFHQSVNLLDDIEINLPDAEKFLLSFEQKYYFRTIEFSDFLRNSLEINDPYINFFTNETSSNKNFNTLTATMPIWLDKVPIAVAGILYNTEFLREFIFKGLLNFNDEIFENLCENDTNVSCYLINEYGSIVLANNDNDQIIGKPFYKENPWIMLELEIDGFFELVIPGSKVEGCKDLRTYANSSRSLFSFINSALKTLFILMYQSFLVLINTISTCSEAYSKVKSDLIKTLELNFENDIKYRNSHCSKFGIYTFNITKWKESDPTNLKTWCNNTQSNIERNYLVGHLQNTNLLMLVVEKEARMSQCESVSSLIEKKRFYRQESPEKHVNRYRKNSGFCYDFYPNESHIFKCNSAGIIRNTSFVILIEVIFAVFLVFIFYF